MSEKSELNNLPEIVITNNNLIKDNLLKLSDKLVKIKYMIKVDEEDEYDNFYNRISFYFSNMVNEIKLIYIESLKVFQEKEMEYKNIISELEDKIKVLEREKTPEKEINNLKKLNNYESELIKLKESNQKILSLNKQNEDDILKLIMENILMKIENLETERENLQVKCYTPMYLDNMKLFTQIDNDNELTILDTNPNFKSRNNRNKSSDIGHSHTNLTFDKISSHKKTIGKIFSTNNYMQLLSKDISIDRNNQSSLDKKHSDSIKNLQKYKKLAKSTHFKLLTNEKYINKTNNSFNFNTKMKQFDPNEVRLTSNTPIEKLKNNSQNNLKKQEAVKSLVNPNIHYNNSKLSPTFKGFLKEKSKILNIKSNQVSSNNPRYDRIIKLSSSEIESYKNKLMDKIFTIKNNTDLNDSDKKVIKDRLINNKSFSKNKK